MEAIQQKIDAKEKKAKEDYQQKLECRFGDDLNYLIDNKNEMMKIDCSEENYALLNLSRDLYQIEKIYKRR